jgi:ribonuclease R
VNVYQKVSKEANWLIEEFMLLANRSVAEYVAKAKKTFVYRIHDEPNQEKLESLRNFVGNFGYRMGPTNSGKDIAKELNGLFAAAKDTPEYNAIELLSLRTMAKARYDIENLGHYGLAFKYYTHFTSPIRRYPDMLVHRLLASYLEGAQSAKAETYAKLCKYASEREIVAAEAERSSVKYKLVEFMQDKVGYTFGGNISGLTEWGMYVEIEPTKIEGMVPLRDIRTDFFEFDADHYRLVGRRSGIVYNLGDPVRIRVKKTNLEQKLLDYELIETGNEDRIYDRLDYEQGRGTSFIKGEDGSFDNVTVGINKAARKENVRKAIKESKRKSRKAKSAGKNSRKR